MLSSNDKKEYQNQLRSQYDDMIQENQNNYEEMVRQHAEGLNKMKILSISANEDDYKKFLSYAIEQFKIGITVQKLHLKLQVFNQRTYNLEIPKNEISANTQQFGKFRKHYSFDKIAKCGIDDFSSLKLSNLDKSQQNKIVKGGLSLVYDNYKKVLYLVAEDEFYRRIFISVIEHFCMPKKNKK